MAAFAMTLSSRAMAGTSTWVDSWNSHALIEVRDYVDSNADHEGTALFEALQTSELVFKFFHTRDSQIRLTCIYNWDWADGKCTWELYNGKSVVIDPQTHRIYFELTGEEAQRWFKLFQIKESSQFNFATADGRLKISSTRESMRFEYRESP